MLSYYQEITLLPDEETPAFFLMSKVFLQIHLVLGHWKNHTGTQPFGISPVRRKKSGRKNQDICRKPGTAGTAGHGKSAGKTERLCSSDIHQESAGKQDYRICILQPLPA